ncbi:DUF1800 domain-containing protein [Sphingomonas sp.]|uniref:DUF1800 domain-containing protein n=1 Tax=Sphingomonas sp. TaxID=28214 RepID=UPI0025D3092D|nr:DUF1800 domain-containing protein [Sphingomonas sp.]
MTATLPTLVLAACGGGGGEGTSASPATPPAPATPAAAAPPTSIEASRFLAQSTMGSTRADIAEVQAQGYESWITAQFAIPRATSHWDWMIGAGYGAATNIFTSNGFNPSVWRQLIVSQDQLRQRVGMALLDFLVVGVDGLNVSWSGMATAAYLDLLLDGAFGNYRDLLDKISTSPAMGLFLSFAGNRKANASTGSEPDENYAREMMQLFTLGLQKLNADGSVQTTNGKPVEIYTQDDVSGLARVFTGFNLDSADSSTADRMRRPMTQKASDHEPGVKTFLGTTIPAGTDGFASLRIALDTVFAHSNMPPFVSRQLIQRLVTSNPSTAYVGRVSAVFANNGSGVPGDMKAVIRAILLDTEARSASGLSNANAGKLREPVMRLTGWARAFGVTSPTDLWPFGDTSSSSNRLAQAPGRSPSVFNFFRPGYSPPNTPISAGAMVAPEFQITNEPSVIAYVNYMQELISSGSGEAQANYAAVMALASDSQKLLDEINLILAAGQISATSLATIKSAIESISATGTSGPANRVYTAILLAMASPEYITQK